MVDRPAPVPAPDRPVVEPAAARTATAPAPGRPAPARPAPLPASAPPAPLPAGTGPGPSLPLSAAATAVVAPVALGRTANGTEVGTALLERPLTGTPDLLEQVEEGTAPSAPPERSVKVRPRRRIPWAVEWVLVLLVAVGVAVSVRTFVVQTFYIPSASMEPTLMIGDRILVDKLSYHLEGVHRGDIVVFGKPPDENAPADVKDLVKRVIGLPGDRISSRAGRVYIDGKPLKEPWLVSGTVTTGIEPETVPPNEYFVMGDNRSDSQDSRYFGPIPRSLIVGRVVVRIWPFSALHVF